MSAALPILPPTNRNSERQTRDYVLTNWLFSLRPFASDNGVRPRFRDLPKWRVDVACHDASK